MNSVIRLLLVINKIDTEMLPMIKRVLADANPGYMVFPSSQSVKMFFEEEQIEELFSPDYLKSVNVITMGDQTERACKVLWSQTRWKTRNSIKASVDRYDS